MQICFKNTRLGLYCINRRFPSNPLQTGGYYNNHGFPSAWMLSNFSQKLEAMKSHFIMKNPSTHSWCNTKSLRFCHLSPPKKVKSFHSPPFVSPPYNVHMHPLLTRHAVYEEEKSERTKALLAPIAYLLAWQLKCLKMLERGRGGYQLVLVKNTKGNKPKTLQASATKKNQKDRHFI